MNICFINPTKKIRVGIKGLSKYLTSNGHKVVILTPKVPERHELDELGSAKIRVYSSIFLPKIRYTIPLFPKQLIVLKEVVDQNKIDVIHIWAYFYPTAWIPLLYGKLNHIPIILTTDGFPGITWSYGSKFVDFNAKLYSKTFGKIILRYCDILLLLNSKIVKYAKKMGSKKCRFMVIPLGLDFNKFYYHKNSEIKKNLNIRKNESMLLYVGRVVPVKGIINLIKITGMLLADNYDIKTVIVGDGPYMDKYKQIADNLGLSQYITFTGFREDIPEIVSSCDVFILPSLSEGLPSALLEAASCSKPIVASDRGGVSDIIIHRKTGFHCNPKDLNSFLYYIEMFLENKSLSKKLGKNAYKYVKSEFDWNTLIINYENIYERVCNLKIR